jgi:very-short-patch-repair endonuclease
MRCSPTESEQVLWQAIRRRRLGVLFRRQVPVPQARCIVDFLAPVSRLVVEVDGGYHARRRGADARRDARLVRAGFVVLRLPAGARAQ